ncbi:branched-chain amino acid transaminase [soil metagenome]|jgi:branched-chain amino acid aminotransferase
MYYKNNTQVYLNGEFVNAADAKVSMFSQSLHYGLSVFEGMRSYDTKEGPRIFKARRHYERFLNSARLMHIPHNFDVDKLIQVSYELLERNKMKDAYIRPLIFLGDNMHLHITGSANIFIGAWRWGKYLGDEQLNVSISSYSRPNPKAFHIETKSSGMYVNGSLATMEAKSGGYDEAIQLDQQGFISQAPGANIFYEKEGRIYTPPQGTIFPGITRRAVMEMAREREIEVIEKRFVTDELYNADVAFLTGTAVELVSIKSINRIPYQKDYKRTVSYELERDFKDYVRTVRHDPSYTII